MKDIAIYKIYVKGRLSSQWAIWFSGMALTHMKLNETCLSGLIPDQPALHGILTRIRDLGLVLIYLERFEIDECPNDLLLNSEGNQKGIHVRN